VPFLDRPDEVPLDFRLSLVPQRHDRARLDHARATAFHDLGVLQQGLEVADPRLHLPLLFLRRVVVAVLGEVAHFAGRLDLARDVDPPAGGEIEVLGLQPLVRGARQLMGLLHRSDATGALPEG
jgi:hypothetical protein